MDRAACVDVPELPLQLLLRREPGWADDAVVVVADDRPQAEVLWVNDAARRHRIRPGMSLAAAQSLDARVRAGVVSPHEIHETIERVAQRLSTFSPRVEVFDAPTPSSSASTKGPRPRAAVEGAPGVFWLDPCGMVPLFTSFEHWGHGIREALEALGLRSTVVVGFHRFRCYALARVRRGVWVNDDPGQETSAAAKVPLDRLTLPAKARDGLHRLGVGTLGELLRLPEADLRARFGEAAAALHACGRDGWAPLRPRPLVEPVRATKSLEPPDDDRTRLLFLLKSMLHDLMVELCDRGQAMSALRLRLRLDHHPEPHDERLEPARPTLDEPMVIDLLRLRLDAATLRAPVEALELELEGVEAPSGQLALFRTQARRDLDAAERALARLRAWLGPEAVTRAHLREAHLPEARFSWSPTATLGFPRPEVVGAAVDVGCEPPLPLQRRLLPRPQRLPAAPPSTASDCEQPWLGTRGPIVSIEGPYRISGGWWVRTVERDYYFVQTEPGELLWVFYDRVRRGWYLQGVVG
ncbi:DNA polymerase Y subunit UmuC family protein [Paraliomyxa miuraensis]|uniref:hypothetical protein n=1 Tax=Paraliomyxa miuraensis TaxID=376150 RepID=UPI002256AF55|nr:hypothetical protein [Paraliomyxa miuraensis]MCX4240125.1 hypothetical protein [Paraliomyxa miuraensis]